MESRDELKEHLRNLIAAEYRTQLTVQSRCIQTHSCNLKTTHMLLHAQHELKLTQATTRNLSRQFVDGFDKAKVDTATKYQNTKFLKGSGKHCKVGSMRKNTHLRCGSRRPSWMSITMRFHKNSQQCIRKIFRNVSSKSRSVPGAACSCGWGV